MTTRSRRLLATVAATLVVCLGGVADASEDEPSFSRLGADSCLACHDDAKTLAVFGTPHGDPHKVHGPFGKEGLQCEACHGPAGDHAGRVRRGAERPPPPVTFNVNALGDGDGDANCLTCHTLDAGFSAASDHASEGLGCADCHAVHDRTAPSPDTTDFCVTCHETQRLESNKPFSHILDDNLHDKPGNSTMSCGSCHSVHGNRGEASLREATINQTCFSCHAEKRGPLLWEHAPVAEDCTTCHAPHGSSHPGMLSQRSPFLCQSCHAESGHPAIANDGSGLAQASASRYLLGQNCMNCHTMIHGSNHPSGSRLMR